VPAPGRRRNSEAQAPESEDDRRERILRAAIVEFSRHGLAGARTDAIAAAAGVNKALLYYYFHSKTELYAAALDASAAQMLESALLSLEHEGSAGERLLRTALNHFDRIASQHEYRQLINQELARLRETDDEAVPAPLEKIFSVLMHKMRLVLAEGMKSGELIRTDWMQVIYAVLGANVFYFLSAPMMRRVADFDPLDEREIRRRRRAALLLLGASLFQDRTQGEQLARQVLRDTPTPAPVRRWQLSPSGESAR
jgi:TetR/AcrR family transcriptional regulator